MTKARRLHKDTHQTILKCMQDKDQVFFVFFNFLLIYQKYIQQNTVQKEMEKITLLSSIFHSHNSLLLYIHSEGYCSYCCVHVSACLFVCSTQGATWFVSVVKLRLYFRLYLINFQLVDFPKKTLYSKVMVSFACMTACSDCLSYF